MKITKAQLKRLIKEELERIFHEGPDAGTDWKAIYEKEYSRLGMGLQPIHGWQMYDSEDDVKKAALLNTLDKLGLDLNSEEAKAIMVAVKGTIK